jgi:hypothetical protein
MTLEITHTFAVEEGALKEAPVYETHKRGKNWMAVIEISPSCPGGLARTFVKNAYGPYYYMINTLKVGDAIEFGGDYYTGRGSKRAERWHGVLIEITESEAKFHRVNGGITCVKTARKFRENV